MIASKKVLLCGASGLLGRGLCTYFKNNGIEFLGTYHSNPIENGVKIDFGNLAEIEKVLMEYKPTFCINSIVERQLEVCEGDWNNTKRINIDFANNIAKMCNKHGVHLIHISTDYVFDGLNPPYYPHSIPNPLQNYGMSKLIAEQRVMSRCRRSAIVRVPVLYSNDLKNLDESAVTVIGKKVLNRIEVQKEDNYSVRRPNYIPDFCEFIGFLMSKESTGIFHYYNPEEHTTKYKMSNMIAEYLGKVNKTIPIQTPPDDGAERPRDTYLLDEKYNINRFPITPLKVGLERCFSKLYHTPIQKAEETDLFFLLDLDGTLLDTDRVHYDCYMEALQVVNGFLEYNVYLDILNNGGIDKYLEDKYGDKKEEIKKLKNEALRKRNIQFIKGADRFIEYLLDHNINHCVVTNTSRENVEYFKEKLPLLNRIKNWIVREDYKEAKPSSECFQKAKEKYYTGEWYVVGIENTLAGYRAIQKVTDRIYLVTNKEDKQYNHFKKLDVYLIDDYNDFFEG